MTTSHLGSVIGLDFETYSDVDLIKHDLDRYVSSPNFQPLLACLAGADGSYVTIDFINNPNALKLLKEHLNGSEVVVAHNAGFEEAVLRWLGIKINVIDSAAIARASGASSSLARSAPQLLGMDKLEMGEHLIKVFSIPGEYQEKAGNTEFQPIITEEKSKEWRDFAEYCRMDARLSREIYLREVKGPINGDFLPMFITQQMNATGWNVDMDLLERMDQQYQRNKEKALASWRAFYDPDGELNFNSPKQLKEWALGLGLRTKSFDEDHVARMIRKVVKQLGRGDLSDDKRIKYSEAWAMLNTKQILGGSALSKLQKIKDTVGPDNRLRNQYVHYGAGQTGRTSGRAVQMQNLKRLGSDIADVSDVSDWDNDKLAENLRQVFTASRPEGLLIVGDFSSVEARGLAWLANEEWVLEAFYRGDDLYKVAAAKQYGIKYGAVSPAQRQFGKVGVLSCGYGAGPGAVKDFAYKMGVELTTLEAGTLVSDWRDTHPNTVQLWADLDLELKNAILKGYARRIPVGPEGNWYVDFMRVDTPSSMDQSKRKLQSVAMFVTNHRGGRYLSRVFHGCYIHHGEVRYHKPNDAKTQENLWKDWFIDNSGKRQNYKLYGGKLSGILTQSFCREIFMDSLRTLYNELRTVPNVRIVGQFHDEIVLEWWRDPAGKTSAEAMMILERCMSLTEIQGFPLGADVKADYRYIK